MLGRIVTLASVLMSSGAAAEGVVYTVNYPLAAFAERIANGAVEVRFPGPPDQDPAFWVPDTETVLDYQRADLILLNGAGYAGWVRTASLPRARLVDTSAAFRDQLIEADGALSHTHGPEGEHDHGGLAFTTWLDPEQARLQASAIHDAMQARWPEHQATFDEGLAALDADLETLDQALAQATARFAGRPLLASHPVYQYLARRYDLDLRSEHFEPDLLPSPEQWEALSALLLEHPAKIMLWEAEPLLETRARLDAMGITVVVFETVNVRPETGDYVSAMERNVERLEAVLP